MKKPKNGKTTLARTTPAQARKAERKLAQVRGCTVAQVRETERKAHARASRRGKLYRADIMGAEFMQARAAEVADADIVVADPMYRPICPKECLFIPVPHEAFSGRTFRRFRTA